MKTTVQLIITIATISFLSACGSSNDDDVKTGVFKDSAVKGLSYKTATQSGITDEKGTFKYKAGETVTFQIGEMKIGSAKGRGILFPTHITNNKVEAIKVAQVLQTLDKDGNPDEGIDIAGQFNVNSTKRHNIQDINNLQALVDDIKTADSLILVEADKAERHMDSIISSERHIISLISPEYYNNTFESLSDQNDINNQISIENNRLKLSLQDSDNVWLLVKNATEVTSLSADIEFVPKAKILHLGLLMELIIDKHIRRFHIVIERGVAQCFLDVTPCPNTVHDYIMITHGGSPYVAETLDESILLYRSEDRPESELEKHMLPSDSFKANFTIAFDKVAKKVIIKYGDKQGYFDMGDYFSSFTQQIQAKFFIKAQSINDSEESVFVDNVKVNGQDFDDFSAPTLDNTKWKTGKFFYRGR